MKKYAIATKINETSYEVFHILEVDPDTEAKQEMIQRIDNALVIDNIRGMNVTRRQNIAIGSRIQQDDFILPDKFSKHWNFDKGISEKNIFGQTNNVFVLLSNNVVFLLLVNIENSSDAEKFAAAFTNDVTIKDISDIATIDLGYIWDGSTWSNPQQ